MKQIKLIEYVIGYTNILKDYINSKSLNSESIANNLNHIQNCALNVINEIIKGNITTIAHIVSACEPMNQAFQIQIIDDMDYTDYMNYTCNKDICISQEFDNQGHIY